MASDALFLVLLGLLCFWFGYEIGEWREEARRNAEWWEARERWDSVRKGDH